VILLEACDVLRTDSHHAVADFIDIFLAAVRAHFLEAYGWFLLAVSGVDDADPGSLPQSTRDLPSPEPGRALMPEIAEFAQLESSGWIAQLIEASADDSHLGQASKNSHAGAAGRDTPSSFGAQGLLVSDREPLGFAVAQAWADSLNSTMARMDDSLAEC